MFVISEDLDRSINFSMPIAGKSYEWTTPRALASCRSGSTHHLWNAKLPPRVDDSLPSLMISIPRGIALENTKHTDLRRVVLLKRPTRSLPVHNSPNIRKQHSRTLIYLCQSAKLYIIGEYVPCVVYRSTLCTCVRIWEDTLSDRPINNRWTEFHGLADRTSTIAILTLVFRRRANAYGAAANTTCKHCRLLRSRCAVESSTRHGLLDHLPVQATSPTRGSCKDLLPPSSSEKDTSGLLDSLTIRLFRQPRQHGGSCRQVFSRPLAGG